MSVDFELLETPVKQDLLSKQPPMSSTSADDFQTPDIAVSYLLPFLPVDSTVWEPACGKGNIIRYLKANGFLAFGTDILSGTDFLTCKPEDSDLIITNPPFSKKDEFLARCYALKRPFALLLPLTVFDSAKRQRLMHSNGVEIVLMPKRINFETPSGQGTGSWFMTCWVTWGLGIGRQLTFTGMEDGGLF